MINVATALRLAPYFAIALLLGAVLWFRGEAISEAAERKAVEVQLTEVRAANDAQKAAIERLTARRAADDALLAELNGSIATLRETAEATQLSIQGLERTNEQVRTYLASPVPSDLRRLLNNRASK